jgi:hypothetical protein
MIWEQIKNSVTSPLKAPVVKSELTKPPKETYNLELLE